MSLEGRTSKAVLSSAPGKFSFRLSRCRRNNLFVYCYSHLLVIVELDLYFAVPTGIRHPVANDIDENAISCLEYSQLGTAMRDSICPELSLATRNHDRFPTSGLPEVVRTLAKNAMGIVDPVKGIREARASLEKVDTNV
jgi:hypothetical protein